MAVLDSRETESRRMSWTPVLSRGDQERPSGARDWVATERGKVLVMDSALATAAMAPPQNAVLSATRESAMWRSGIDGDGADGSLRARMAIAPPPPKSILAVLPA